MSILYQYACSDGHRFEQFAQLADFDKAVRCKVRGCRKPAAREIHAPGLAFRAMASDADAYHRHNITRRVEGGTVTALPNSAADQCKCGACSRHRRRASVTDVAEPGKVR
ncbi:MAG TPA: hypothetical protein VKW06_07880 [Candidatus Angelobacter sp.]|nr:hypothetical protein [Candidatus Angelobacter sp.]